MTNIVLDGTWKYFIDYKSNGEEEGFWKKEYEELDWKEVEIPCNWYIGLGLDYNGIVWFTKKISIDSNWKNKLIRIFCKGIDYYTKIWVNGEFVGFHEGYFGQFSFNISKYLDFDNLQNNKIVIQVNAPFDEGYPMKKRQYKGGFIHWDCRPGSISKRGQERGSGGIWDSVLLKISNRLHFKYVKIVSNDIGKEKSKVKLFIAGFNSIKDGLTDVKLQIKVLPKNFEGKEQEFLININKIASGRFYIDQEITLNEPKLWWSWDLGDPNLYIIKISLSLKNDVLDEWKDTFGIRLVEYKKDSWYLNSEKVFLRGANFFSKLWLCLMDDSEYIKCVNLVREANLNFLRISYHVEKSNFYDIIDDAGVLLQQDFPTLWDYEYTEESVNAGIVQCKEMATQLHNHPSIIIYSCFTEPFRTECHRMGKIFKKAVESVDLFRRVVWSESSFFGHPFCGWYMQTKYAYLSCPGAPYPSEFGPQSFPNLNSPTWNEENLNVKKNWPPNKHWLYHNSQTLIHTYIRKSTPNLGLKGMIEHSQNDQADNLKMAIETFRRHKGKYHMFALFMFKDAWPSITWSIVDYFYLKKKAFYAVKNACSPVLCSFSLSELTYPLPKIKAGLIDIGSIFLGELKGMFWRESISPGQKKPIYLYVINDLISKIDGKLVLKGEYNGKPFFERQLNINILKSSNKMYIKLNLKLNKAIKTGVIKIIAKLYDKNDNQLLSSNSIDLSIKPKWKKLINALILPIRSQKNSMTALLQLMKMGLG